MKITLTIMFCLTLNAGHSQCPIEYDYISENNFRQIIITNKIKAISNLRIGVGCYPSILNKDSHLNYDSITHSKTYYNSQGYIDSSYIRDYDNSNNITKIYEKYLFDNKTNRLLKTITRTIRIDQYGTKVFGVIESKYIYDKNGNRILSIHGDTNTFATVFKYSYDVNNKFKTLDINVFTNGKKGLCQHSEIITSEGDVLKIGGFSPTEVNAVYKPMRDFDEQMHPINFAKFNKQDFLIEQAYPYKKCKDQYYYEYY